MSAVREGKGSAPVAVGCLLAIPGFFGGGMIAVGVGKLVDAFTRCVPAEDVPACNWFDYWLVGSLIGLVVLPGVALWMLRRRRPADRASDRS